MPRTYYDDNFGHYEIQSEEDVEFYHAVQKRNVIKKCAGCGRIVKIQPDYAICNSCATRAEHGLEY
jgi:rRNA maturation endonuclease Nob1